MGFHAYTPLFLVILVIVAVFGMPLMLASPMHHDTGCPFMSGQAAICVASILEHIQHWQIAFATILGEILLIAALALVAAWQWKTHDPPQRSFARIWMRSRAPDRPTLLQELFSETPLF